MRLKYTAGLLLVGHLQSYIAPSRKWMGPTIAPFSLDSLLCLDPAEGFHPNVWGVRIRQLIYPRNFSAEVGLC